MKNVMKSMSCMIVFGLTSCVPAHFIQLDGRTTEGNLNQTGKEAATLTDESGQSFSVGGKQMIVEFEISQVGDSKVKLTNQGKQAIFRLPKKQLAKGGDTMVIPSWESGQPVDVKVTTTHVVVRQWKELRREAVPNCVPKNTVDSDGRVSSSMACLGATYTYFEDTVQTVQDGYHVDAYKKGAFAKGFPEEMKHGHLELVTSTATHTASRVILSYEDYVRKSVHKSSESAQLNVSTANAS